MTKNDDPRLLGRAPEFARMSLRPGIGALAVSDIAGTVRQNDLAPDGIVPTALQHGRNILPLGRYLRRKLRLALGLLEGSTDEEIARFQAELQDLREIARSLSESGVYAPGHFNQEIFKALLVEKDDQAVKQMLFRRKLYERGKRETF